MFEAHHENLSAMTSTTLIRGIQWRRSEAWERLVHLYGPMIFRWARKAGLPTQDAADIVQDVFLAVSKDINRFHHSRNSYGFRGWLRTICRNQVVNHFRKKDVAIANGGSNAQYLLQQLADSFAGDDQDTDDELCRLRHRMLGLMERQFSEHECQSFLRIFVHGDRATDVAKDLNISVATVYRARYRVLQWLKKELSEAQW